MTPRVQLLPTGRERRFRTDHGLDKYGASYDGPDFAIFRPGYDFLYELLYRDVYGRVADCVAAFGRVAKPNADLIGADGEVNFRYSRRDKDAVLEQLTHLYNALVVDVYEKVCLDANAGLGMNNPACRGFNPEPDGIRYIQGPGRMVYRELWLSLVDDLCEELSQDLIRDFEEQSAIEDEKREWYM